MKPKILIMFGAMLMMLFLITSCWPTKAPVLRTYSISGEIEFVNDCSGVGADNPKEIEVVARLWYKRIGVFPDVTKRQKVKMVLQADGVTSKGKFKIKDVPTNMRGRKWTLEFPDACATIGCEVGTCTNMATNPRMPIRIRAENTTYDYRYSCTCLR